MKTDYEYNFYNATGKSKSSHPDEYIKWLESELNELENYNKVSFIEDEVISNSIYKLMDEGRYIGTESYGYIEDLCRQWVIQEEFTNMSRDHIYNNKDLLESSPLYALHYLIDPVNETRLGSSYVCHLEYIVAKSARCSYIYAKEHLKSIFPPGELEISKSPELSYLYARNVIRGKFEEGELAISTLAYLSVYYAVDILEGRFFMAENLIAESPELSLSYAAELGFRFTKGESSIARSPSKSLTYAREVLQGRFFEGEPTIARDAELSYLYARDVINGRFELCEEVIMYSGSTSLAYAYVIGERFIKGEFSIIDSPNLSIRYAKEIIKGEFPEGEEAISRDADYSYSYAVDVIKGRFEKGELSILNSNRRDSYMKFLESLKYGIPFIDTDEDYDELPF